MFCRYCGNQVLDEAYMCPSCGKMLKALPVQVADPVQTAEPVQTVQEAQPKRDKFKVAAMVLSIVATVFSGIQLVLVGLTVGTLGTAFRGAGHTEGDWLALAWLGIVWLVYAVYALIILSPFSTATGIIGFCFGRKTENKKIRKLSLVAFILAMVTLACAVFVMMCLCVGNG